MGDEPLAITLDPADSGTGGSADSADGTGRSPRRVSCKLCGRPLTGAGSRRTGLGPTCDAKLHPPAPGIRTRRHEVAQDPLPGTEPEGDPGDPGDGR
ncbi:MULTISPECIES: DUF6011 domain-containing protein [unclassified Streptomyces]|uniref:DUF6011 domain-containing protein n=1 Tax=unclassified Streptomyces TaxID=2593676 RepID=UPI0038255C1B